jgi:DNA-binding NarL/FixJ family response regulator
MPRKNGLECLSDIRSNPLFNSTKIIIYSTSSRKKDIDDTRDLGANMYFIKPSSYETLVTKLREILTMDWVNQSPSFSDDRYIFSESREPL